MIRHLAIPVLILLAIASGAVAQVQPPDYGIQWRTVAAPGNRATTQQEAPNLFPPFLIPANPLGAVGYQFRMSRTEISNQQWLEFLNAYWPYHGSNPIDVDLTGTWIQVTNQTPGENPGFRIIPGFEQVAADMSWRNAARYCNWLTNARAANGQAFESGAYDTSTFITNPDGSVQDQRTRSPGALFWIPSLNEWTKAMYYDPAKGGPGVDGYWRYPTSSDTAPESGPPGLGQTSAGSAAFPVWPVGSYPNVLSPWGLLDGSGSLREWTEDLLGPQFYDRAVKGSAQGGGVFQDRLDYYSTGFADGGTNGLRLASSVPTPSSAVLICFAGCSLLSRRFRCDSTGDASSFEP